MNNTKMNKYYTLFRVSIIAILVLLFLNDSNAAEKISLTLQDCISLARGESPSSYIAKQQFRNSQLTYESVMRRFYPQITISGSVPGLNRAINQITLPDGSETFVEQSNLFSQGSLNINQSIPLTGGQLSVSSSLSRIDILGDQETFFWRATPIEVSLIQPIFQYNDMKWRRRIENLRMSMGQRQFIESMEQLSSDITFKFFEAYIAKMNVENAEFNLAINDTLYDLSEGRYRVGKIAENDLLQSELALMNARNDLESELLTYKRTIDELKVILGLSGDIELEIIPPNDIPIFDVDIEIATNQALANRSDMIDFDLRKARAEQSLDQAESNNRFNANLRASFGLNQTGKDIPKSVKNLLDQERVNISFEIPLLNFGANSADVESAMALQEITSKSIEVEMQNFELDVKYQTLRFLQLRDQVAISSKADTIAQRRFLVAKNRYLISKIDLNTFFIAQNEKDAARRNYFSTLRNYWVAYYNLRRLTLYDFEKNTQIAN